MELSAGGPLGSVLTVKRRGVGIFAFCLFAFSYVFVFNASKPRGEGRDGEPRIISCSAVGERAAVHVNASLRGGGLFVTIRAWSTWYTIDIQAAVVVYL